jgi:hypothetical protein
LLLAGIAASNAGCLVVAVGAAAAGGAAGYAYYKGRVSKDYPAGFEETWTATQAALNDLGLPLASLEHDVGRGEIGSRPADGPKVDVSVEALPGGKGLTSLTRVSVRVGIFGDRRLSEQILAQVQTRLGSCSEAVNAAAQPGQPIPAPPAQLPPQTVAPPLAEDHTK